MSEIRKVSIISGICVEFDAISASVRDDAIAFDLTHNFAVKVFTYRNEYPEVDAVVVNGLSDIIFHPFFIDSDLIIYHFGVYCDLFNAIFIGNGRAPQVVRYHNITAKQWLPKRDWVTIDRSLEQMHNMAIATRVWPVSDTNRTDLLETEIVAPEKIEVIPLIVGHGRRLGRMADKPCDALNLVFLGRFVQSKGLLDLIPVMARLRRELERPVSLRLLGSLRFSHDDYIDKLRRAILDANLDDCITVVGEVTDAQMAVEFSRAHILMLPSYHEGFCKPVIEAMQFGCVPVMYDSGNLRYVARGYAATAPAGDVDALCHRALTIAGALDHWFSGVAELVLEVDAGRFDLDDYEAGVDKVLESYSLTTVAQKLRAAAEALLAEEC